MSDLNAKVANATKWSAFAEIIGKLIGPITTMVLARVLTPEAFGVVTTLTMIIAFAEIFTDAGFQRYIIQHEFVDDDDRDKSTNVAFWSNFTMSFLLWGVIAIFSEPLAKLVGNPGLGIVLVVACSAIPLEAFSSIQMAVFRRSLDFKSLFYRRLVAVVIPLFITVPLALWLRSYWALVFGTIAVNLSNAIILTIQSPWRPQLYYSFSRLKDMLSFSVWSMFDAVLIWATSYIEIFFIGCMLSSYYLGIYKTSMTTVVQFTSIITSAILPVVMPALSRTQHDYSAMRQMLLKIQKYLGMLLLPIGFGIFMFSQFITDVLLGSQWQEAVPFIGIWGLMEVVTVVFQRICSNIFPAIGKPRISVTVQLLHLVVLIPAVYISIGYGFSVLFYTRAFVRLEGVVVSMIFAYYAIRLSAVSMIRNLIPEFFACIVMSILASYLLTISNNMIVSLCWIILCACTYCSILYLIPQERLLLIELKKKILKH
ncbi:lipopolysaccharide biosynthesis protein [uncultured Bacteroides sp.]|uniref:lipopolysaccharide biosynthesis protein n=1 Tax=uncultured Bacteroides sp. TaxID=162156 RepID=UPI002674F596|nr:lipopolysaccharide biosynthesis protein [uncultured Bacteroides sp.]